MYTVKQSAEIMANDRIGDGIYSMWLKNHAMVGTAAPGQFISLYCKDGSRILPRPISICEIDKANSLLRVVFRILGEGTKEIAHYKVGSMIEVMGPLGNGFIMDQIKSAIIIGGGIGIPPMLELVKQMNCDKTIVLGYRDEVFLNTEFEPYGKVYISTEDGSSGIKGNVVDAIRANELIGDMIFACGPTPMLKGVKSLSEELKIPAQISMEERMACGIGACLACVCKSKDKDEHTNVNNKRVCKEGPVFFADQILL